MKAAFLTSSKTLEVRKVPEPDVPDDGLVMETRACGICG